MTAVIVAVSIIVVGGAATVAFLRSVRGRQTSVSSDVQRFQSSLDALRPRSAPQPRRDAGTMGDRPGDGG